MRTPERSPLVPLLLALALVVASVGRADAFVLFLTEGDVPLRWKHASTTIRTSTVAPEELDPSAVRAALVTAIATWQDTGCAPTLSVTGTTDATQGTLPATLAGPADNIVVFIRTTAHWQARRHGSTEIAVTVVAHNPKTGEIVDADIEVNDGGFDFSLAATPGPGEVDFASTLTHELGHFLGLDHSLDRSATMYADYDPSDPVGKRSLAQDDIDGVCALDAVPFPRPDDCAAGGSPALLGLVALALIGRARRSREATRQRR